MFYQDFMDHEGSFISLRVFYYTGQFSCVLYEEQTGVPYLNKEGEKVFHVDI